MPLMQLVGGAGGGGGECSTDVKESEGNIQGVGVRYTELILGISFGQGPYPPKRIT